MEIINRKTKDPDIFDKQERIQVAAASESFDEPLTKEQVLVIVDPFIV